MKSRWMVLTLGGLLALALSACGAAETSTPEPEDFTDVGPDTLVSEGRLEPRQRVDLAFLVSGQVKQVLVPEGGTVKAGQEIVRLDAMEQQQAIKKAQVAIEQAQVSVASAQHNLESLAGWSPNKSQLNAAQADLANAEAAVKAAQTAYDKVAFDPSVSSTAQSLALEQATNNFNKAKSQLDILYSTRPDITQARNALEAADLALTAAELDLEKAKLALERMALRAPFGGTVTTLNADEGASVVAGQPVATVADLTEWVVETGDLTELQVVRVSVGQKALIVFDALPDKTFHGEIVSIATQYVENHGDITYTVTISLDDPDPALRWGMTATVEFIE